MKTVEQYITRLRQKAVFCDFHNIDENIRDQVIEKCYSQRLRRKLLERNNVTLVQLREIAQSLEASEQRAVTMEQINKISQHKFDKHCPKVKNQITNKDDVLRVGTRDILRQTLNVQQGKRNEENARKKDISKNVAKQNKSEITTRGVVTQL